MSDAGRKNFSDKISEGLTPNDQKSFGEKAKESVTDAYDKVAKEVQPDSQKSVGQKAGDVASDIKGDTKDAGNSVGKDAEQKGDSFLQQAQDSAKSALNAAGEYVNSASEYVQGKTN